MTIRLGILGAARIAPAALIRPARRVDGVEVVAVAARDRDRAEAFARKHRIPRVVESYDALLEDDAVDAVYNPLPNGLHGVWTIKAIEAGKHVLCEKPFTANATEADAVRAVARANPSRVVMEAFHYRYHSFTDRVLQILATGDVGEVQHIETRMVIPLPRRNDIRWQLALAGGSLMDVGCYTIHLLRTLAGAEPEVVSAEARVLSPGIDKWARAQMRFADGRTGQITASMRSREFLRLDARVRGTRGELRIRNPYAPQFLGRATVNGRTIRAERKPTYAFQLEAFRDAVADGKPVITDVDDAVANMAVIDAVYRAAGLEVREPSTR